MKIWSDDEGTEFQNSDACWGKEFQPASRRVDIAKIFVRGEYPAAKSWGYLLESSEIVVIVRGEGTICKKGEQPIPIKAGDVVSIETHEGYRWSGDLDMIIACSPAFDPKQVKIEEES